MSIEKENKIPFYLKATIFLVGIIALLSILSIAQAIIVPIVLSIIIAILLQPIVNFFVRKKINRVISIVITLILTIIVIAGLSLLIGSQLTRFGESWPVLVEKFTKIINSTIVWVSGYFDINPLVIKDWIANTKAGLISASGSIIGQTIVGLGSFLIILFLIPVYIFMILFYQPLLLEFVRRLFSKSNQTEVGEVITQIKTVIQRYLSGLVIEAAIVAALNITVLLILGIDYAILLGIIGALLNVIPYLGGLVAVALPMMIALVTKDSGWYAIYVLVLYYIIQLIDNNYIVPKIVASKVKINALFSIIVVIAGNSLWGLTGMFLSIPLLAIVKLIFDHIEPLKPWGFLLGDTMPPILKLKPIRIKRTKKTIS